MTEPREALAALREAWHEEDQAEAQMSVADYDGEKRTAERRLTAARAAAREAEAAVGVHLGDEGLRAALERMREFAMHDESCLFAADLSGINGDEWQGSNARPCSCGFDGALVLYEAAVRGCDRRRLPMTDREALTDRLQEAILDLDSRQLMAEAQGYSSAEWRRWTAREIAEDLARQVARSEGPGLDALLAARKAMSDRLDDLMWCNKDDDCHIQAKGVELAIADFDAALAAQEEAPDD